MKNRKVSRREFLQLTTVATTGAFLAACVQASQVGQAGSATGQEASASTQGAEVAWFVRSSPTENPWQREQVVPRFGELHPEIKINLIVTPGAEAYSKLLALNAAGTTPDVWSNNFGAGFTGGLGLDMIRPMSDFIDASGVIKLDDYGQPVVNLFTRGGKVWAVPSMTCGTFLFYNKDLLDEAGVEYPTVNWDDRSWTWDKMVELAQKVTKNYGMGTDAQYGLMFAMEPYVLQWLWGTDPFPPEAYETGYPCTIDFTSEKSIAALQAGVDLIFKDKVSPSRADQDAISAGGDPFRTGKVVMLITGGWGFWGMKDFTDFKWGAAAIPRKETTADPLWPDANMISKTSKAPDAAWQLVEYISSGDGMKGFIDATQSQPAPRSLWPEWYSLFEDKIPLEELKAGMEGSVKYGKIPYSHTMVETNRLYTVMAQQFDPMWLGEKSVAETAATAQAEVQKILDENCGKSL